VEGEMGRIACVVNRGSKSDRRKGSNLDRRKHHISLYKQSDDKTYLVVVPDKKEVKRGTVFSILKQAGMSREKFLELVKKINPKYQ